MNDGSYVTRTYVFDDIVRALNAVAPYDWAGYLNARLYADAPQAPLDGITRGGYRLTYTDVETPFLKSVENDRSFVDLSYSLGLTLTADGTVRSVIWGSPAFKAGVAIGTQLVAVDGLSFDMDELKRTLVDGHGTTTPIEILLKAGRRYRTLQIDYHGGLRYPYLERVASTPDYLGAILTPRP